MRQYRFYKNELGWFIDIKYFPFNKAYLAMIAGADDLLDLLAEGKNEITLKISTSPIPYSDGMLERHVKLGLFQGAFYFSREGYMNRGTSAIESVWLCPVTLWVFLKYPKKIYYKIIE